MDTQKTLAHQDYSSNVDTSRPFRSVKEAIAIFGERLLIGDINSTKSVRTYDNHNNNTNPCKEIVTSECIIPSPTQSQQIKPKKDDNANLEQDVLFDMLKKLESELEGTKTELKLLKERGSETEIALATLNAELHKNMSNLAEAEAAAAAKNAKAAIRTVSSIDKKKEEEGRMKRDLTTRMDNLPTLSQILSIGENEIYYGGKIKEKRENLRKEKPIVPLITDFFFKKKGTSSTTLHNHLCATPINYFN